MLFIRLLFCIVLHMIVHIASAQEIPPVPCPQYFEYLKYADEYIGKVTIPNYPSGTVKVEVNFSQRSPLPENYFGRLVFFNNDDTVINNIHTGKPISYRASFPTKNVVPKLTRITVNGNIICMGSDYPPPAWVINMQRTSQATVTTLGNPVPSASGINTISQHQNAGPYFSPNLLQTNIGSLDRILPTYQASPMGQQQPQPSMGPPQQPQQQPPRPSPQQAGECGRENKILQPFVYGGKVLERGQYPWLVAIYRRQIDNFSFKCGGSLISMYTVLTAAHCIKDVIPSPEEALIHLGRYDLTKYHEEGQEVRTVKHTVIHPEYDVSRRPDADIAILITAEPIRYTNYIRPICLWSGPNDVALIQGMKGYVAGWGADEQGNKLSQFPKVVDASIATEANCVRDNMILATNRTLCAGNRDSTGPCMGDSGGGLMMSRDDIWMLRAIVSTGPADRERCKLQTYVFYCDLAKHIVWIEANMV